MLQHEGSNEHNKAFESVGVSPICNVVQSNKMLPKINHRELRIDTLNFFGLCSDRELSETGEVLSSCMELDSLGIYVLD